MSDKVIRVQDDDPERCQGTRPFGQCSNKRMEGSNYCPACGGNKAVDAASMESVRNYRLTKWQGKLNKMADSSVIKSLREEIGILRIMLEERLNMCETQTDLMMHSSSISDMVLKIEKVVTSCHKIDNSMGQLLDKQVLLQYAQDVITILTTEIQDKLVLDCVANKIINLLGDKDVD